MPPREAAADEVLGQVVVGNYDVSLFRRAGAVLARVSMGSASVSNRRVSLPPLPSLHDLPPLLDRDIELAAVQSLLRATPPPIVEISGRSGVGKTALVRCLTNVLYIDAAGMQFRAFLQHLYACAFQAEVACVPGIERLRVLFSSWRTPVVIDGFQGTGRELHTILDILKRVPVVYTTIDQLHLDPSVAELRLTGLRPDAARELFERSFGAAVADDPETMEFVNVVLEGNPLLIAHAAALARAGALQALQGPEPIAALTFNHMTISEQQIFAAVAGFGGARPSRETVEIVSEVVRAGAVINGLLARTILQTDGERLWISPLMRPVLSAASSLIRYEAMFTHADAVLSQPEIPRSVIENPQPLLHILRLAETKGRYPQIARNARAFADALLLAGKTDEAREACELVRSVGNEVRDPSLQAWAQHQLGTLFALSGDVAEGISWLESAEVLRDRIGDAAGKYYSQKNVALLRKAPVSKKGKEPKGIVWDVTLISWTMGLIAFVAISHAFGWSTVHIPKSRGRMHAHFAYHTGAAKKMVSAAFFDDGTHSAFARKKEVAPVSAARVEQTPLPVPLFVASAVVVSNARFNPIRIMRRRAVPVARHIVAGTTAVPRIAQFTTSRSRIVAGGSAELCFKLANASSAFLEPVGKLNPRSGCVSDVPRVNTYYTLYAYNQNGMASASLRIDVLPTEDRQSDAQEARVP